MGGPTALCGLGKNAKRARVTKSTWSHWGGHHILVKSRPQGRCAASAAQRTLSGASGDATAVRVRALLRDRQMQREAALAHTADHPNRRDFIVIAAQAFAGVGAAAALWPFIHQMNPDASTQALASIEVDLAPRQGRSGDHRVLARQAGVHPQPDGGRDQQGERGQGRRAVGSQRAQRRAAREGAGLRRQPHQEGPRELAGPGRHLHAPGLHPQGPVAVDDSGATTAAGSAPAMARTTTPRAASAKARRRATSKCRPTSSRPTPGSRSAEGPHDGSHESTYRPTTALGQVDGCAAARRAHDAWAVRRLSRRRATSTTCGPPAAS